jgi:hypothetical protein
LNASQRWILTLLENLDAGVDGETRAKVLEACGRTCLPKALKAKARKLYEKAHGRDAFLDALSALWPAVKRDGEAVHVVYPQCYCSLLKGISGAVSPSFCLCSAGYVKELFEYVTGRPVTVELESSIVRGGSECRCGVEL